MPCKKTPQKYVMLTCKKNTTKKKYVMLTCKKKPQKYVMLTCKKKQKGKTPTAFSKKRGNFFFFVCFFYKSFLIFMAHFFPLQLMNQNPFIIV